MMARIGKKQGGSNNKEESVVLIRKAMMDPNLLNEKRNF